MSVVKTMRNTKLGSFASFAHEPEKPSRIDLEWAKQKITGFADMMRRVQAVKASEAEYARLKPEQPLIEASK